MCLLNSNQTHLAELQAQEEVVGYKVLLGRHGPCSNFVFQKGENVSPGGPGFHVFETLIAAHQWRLSVLENIFQVRVRGCDIVDALESAVREMKEYLKGSGR